jgi:hypothetical protein
MSIPLSSNFNLNTALPIETSMVVADNTARDAIATVKRFEGMFTYNVALGITYQLQGGVTNADWVALSAAGSPGGANTNVQFNDSGTFGGNAGFVYNKTDFRVGIGGIAAPSTTLELYSNTFPSTLPYITDNGVALTLNNTIGTSVMTSHYSTAGGSNSSVLDFLPDPVQFPDIGLRFVGYPIIGTRDSFLELFSSPGSYSILEGVLGDGLFITTESGGGTAPVIIGVDRIPQVYFNPTNVHFLPHGTSAGNTYEIRLRELAANGTDYIGWKAPDARTSNTSLIIQLPVDDPSAGQTMVFSAPSSGVSTATWATITPSGTAWLLDGNTVGSEKYIGTDDNFRFPVRVNNVEVWSFETDSSIKRDGGLYSISSATTVSWGPSAGSAVNNTNTESVLLGYFAGASSTSTGLVIISSDTNNPSFATTYGNATIAIGNGALALSTNGFNVGVGVGAGLYTTTGTGNVYLGYNADNNPTFGNATGSNNIVFGQYGYVGGNFSSVFSSQGLPTASNQIVFGGGNSSAFYSAGYFGNGVLNSTPQNFVFNGTGGSGTDKNGANVTIAAGKGTGSGTPGSVIIQSPTIGSTGTTLQTLSDRMIVDGTKAYMSSFRFEVAKGASVASGTTVTLGNDGNLFHITGSTTLNTITATNWQQGSIITLHFDSNPTVKDQTSGGGTGLPLRLNGSVDFIAATSSRLMLYLDGDFWWEISRTIA